MSKHQSKINLITTEMAEFICDELCKHPKELTESEIEEVCCECRLGLYICDILNECEREKP